MAEDLKLSQIGSSQLPPPFRGLHSPGVRNHCQIIFACYFRKSSIAVSAETEPHICTTQTRTSVKQRTVKTKQAVSDSEGLEQTTCSTAL